MISHLKWFSLALLALPTILWAQSFGPIGTHTARSVASGNRSLWAVGDPLQPTQEVWRYEPMIGDFLMRPAAGEDYPPVFMGTGGGNLLQPDETWAHFHLTGERRFDSTTQDWVQPANVATDLRAHRYVVGVGYADACHPYEVWVERSDANGANPFLARFDYCLLGGVFTAVSTPVNLNHVATGGGEVWALDTSGHVFRFDAAARQFKPMPGSLAQIAVGVDGAWGLNGSGRAFEFNAIRQDWDALASPRLDALWAGGDGVFAAQCLGPVVVAERQVAQAGAAAASSVVIPPGAVCGRTQLMRYEPVTRRFVAITTGYQPDTLSVGSGGGAVGVEPQFGWVMEWLE